ncbi:MAG: aldehyde dehydrogenase family protein [Micavibrio sp.]|nr:MAG: aldehyde dehydrogenase family protein [Micavibrio sp.]
MQKQTAELMERFGVDPALYQGGSLKVFTPVDGSEIAAVVEDTRESAEAKIAAAHEAFLAWRRIPAPKRGELIRLFGDVLRAYKEPLGRLVSLECGKILSEGQGEVQEMIDICDFALGLSRQLYGLTIASERPGHKMQENWHPLGAIGVITAFNFPVAVWAWNAALAFVCGDPVVWKPSEKTPLTALACQALFEKALKQYDGDAPAGLLSVVIGEREIGEALVDDARLPLISATGSTRMGREVAPRVAARFARSILELGGNNAMILAPSADLDLALTATVFGAVGTAGQRCTTQRRLIAHKDVIDGFVERVKKAYETVSIGSPLEEKTLMGPLIDKESFENMQDALEKARQAGGKVFGGKRVLDDRFPEAYYVTPAIVEFDKQTELMHRETFAPILYVVPYEKFDEAVAMQNAVPQGLSSCLFTNDMREAETFTGPWGSDCGIANVNLGTSGAEIGGAFGGEKETGGGRESGSDSWKAYMRRSTNTLNFSSDLPLAQGVSFDVKG